MCTTHNTRLATRLRGLRKNHPIPQWPGDARVALNFNLNYETGGEANILADPASEGMLNDIGFPPVSGKRNPLVESAFEYGSRVGVWRVLRIFAKFDILSVSSAWPQHLSKSGHPRLCRRRPRDRQPWLSLDRLSSHRRRDGTRTYTPGCGNDRAPSWHAPSWVDDRAARAKHAAPARRNR